MRLYRPVGVAELLLIQEADYRAFPPRLAHQPIFYPVLNLAYAEQIARDWNTKDEASGFAGFVTAFEVPHTMVEEYPTKTVGRSNHEELWVPATELSLFNQRLQSKIEVIAHFVGSGFRGTINPSTHEVATEAPPTHTTPWRIFRMDDNGNEFEVESGLTLETALRRVAEFEARGHKQTYWARVTKQ